MTLYKLTYPFFSKINDCKTMINYWNAETLSNQEIKCLLIAFDKILKEFKDLDKGFEKMKADIGSIREDVE